MIIVLDDCGWFLYVFIRLNPNTRGAGSVSAKDPSITKENLEAVGEADASLLEGTMPAFLKGEGKVGIFTDI